MPDTCPVCRNVNESGATSCLRCGVTFAAIPSASTESGHSAGAVPPVTKKKDSGAGQFRVPRGRLVIVLSVLAAGAALIFAAHTWWQSGAEARRDKEAWDRAKASNTTAAYKGYLTGATLGAHSEDAKNAIRLRLDAAVSRLRSSTNNGNHEAVEAFTALAGHARDADANELPVYFVRDVRLSNADVFRMAKQAGAARYAAIEPALSPAALNYYEAEIVVKIAAEMRSLGFDELQLTQTGPVEQPAIRVSYSIRPDGGLYQIVSPEGAPPSPGRAGQPGELPQPRGDEAGAAGRSATVYAGVIIRARYEFVVAGSEPLFAFDAEARPADKLRFSRDPYREMCSSGFGTIRLKFTSLFNPAPG